MATKLAALYYPHITIENEGILKNALLLSDVVELICPFGEFRQRPIQPEEQLAFDMIARPLQPTQDDKRRAHEAIIEVANSSLPKWFFPRIAS
jgi:hypothetical protein